VLFLIEYDRNHGRIVELEVFDDSERQKAEDSRLERELALNRASIEHEVVLLEAATEEALRRTHRRYFVDTLRISEDLDELVKSPRGIDE
jgi:hypothetical protein